MAKITKEVSYVKFVKNDVASGFKFKVGEVFKATESDKGMTLIGTAWIWNSSVSPATEDEYIAYVSVNGVRRISNEKTAPKKVVISHDGKKLTEIKKTEKFSYFSVDGGNAPKTITEAKKIAKIGSKDVFDIKIFKDEKYHFAIKTNKVG